MNAPFISVAMLMGNMANGGVEAVVMNYIRRLAAEGIRVDLLLHESSSFPQRRELEALRLRFHFIPSYSKPLSYYKACRALFEKWKYTIVHAHVSTMNVFPLLAAWRAGVPVRICHNHSTAHWGETVKTLMKYVLRIPSRLVATDYFACGEYAGRWMFGNRLFEAGQVFVAPNAINGLNYAFNAESRMKIRSGLGLGEDVFVAGHVGRFCYPKNHMFLLDIFAAIKQRNPKAVLLLVGEGPDRPRIEKAAKRQCLAESVRFTGDQDDMGAWYSAMDVFLLPSLYEGLPLVAVEAQANGLPCLFSDNITTRFYWRKTWPDSPWNRVRTIGRGKR